MKPFLFLSFLPSLALAAPDFHTDIAPLLRDYCAGCHNADDREGDLSVETFAELMRGGESGPSIVPGKAAESFLVRTVTKEEKPTMPPKKEPQPTEKEIAVLKAWVDAGAKGPEAAQDVSILSTLIVPKVAAQAGVQQPITAAEVSPDGRWMALARHDVVEIVNVADQKVTRRLANHPGAVNAVHFSKEGQFLLTASGVAGLRGNATLWEVANGRKIREFGAGSRDMLYDAEFTPDGRFIATAGYDRTITLWDTKTGELRRKIEGHNGAVFDLAFSPDGKVLASASADQTIKLWQTSTGERLDTLNQPQGEQYAVRFTPDGRHVIAGGADNRIRLWRLVSIDKPQLNPLVQARFAHEGDIVGLALSQDGKSMFSSSTDLTLRVWSLPDIELMETLEQQPDVAAAVALVPGTPQMLAARMDGSLAFYTLPKATKPGGTNELKQVPVTMPVAENFDPQKFTPLTESEPNDTASQGMSLPKNSIVSGVIGGPGDLDHYRFQSKSGEEWVFEVNAQRMKSPLDSKIEILHADGKPVEQVVLRAVRDSWFTFRGKDSDTITDFRVHNWAEMDLNEYLYANGEVVKFWLYPRGPDSGFNVYPGMGKRHTYFGTTALSHPLGEPCYIVQALPAGSNPAPNGLPIFRLHFENDDDPLRRHGKDSYLIFTAPEAGDYVLRLQDVTNRGGADFKYQLTARARQEDFKLTLTGQNPAISPGSGKEFALALERLDGFDGEVTVEVSGLPPGFSAVTPVVIEPEQISAVGLIMADLKAEPPTDEQIKAVKLTATASIRGRKVTRELGGLGKITLGKPSQVVVEVFPDGTMGAPKQEPGKPLELTIQPGETISAWVKVTRRGAFKAEVPFGKEDAGRNLPFGVYVDNIGLNGLLVPATETERRFFITAGPKWLPETTRFFHLRTTTDGIQTSQPILLKIRKQSGVAAR